MFIYSSFEPKTQLKGGHCIILSSIYWILLKSHPLGGTAATHQPNHPHTCAYAWTCRSSAPQVLIEADDLHSTPKRQARTALLKFSLSLAPPQR